MTKSPLVRVALITGIILVISVIVTHLLIRKKLEYSLKHNLPTGLNIEFFDLELNVLGGLAAIEDVTLQFGDDSLSPRISLEAESLQLMKPRYLQWLFKDTLIFRESLIADPIIHIHASGSIPELDIKMTNTNRALGVELFRVKDGTVFVYNKEESGAALEMRHIDLDFYNFSTALFFDGSNTNLDSSRFNFSCDTLLGKFKPYRESIAEQIVLRDDALSAMNIHLRTKLSRARFSELIPSERDHIDLRIPEVLIDDFHISRSEQKMHISSSLVTVVSPQMGIYRDKRVDDDNRVKPLFSTILRELPLDMNIKELKFKKGYLSYSEELQNVNSSGKIFFEQCYIHVTNLCNTLENVNNTEVKGIAKIMGTADAELNYVFNVNHMDDRFTTTGILRGLDMKKINSFIEPGLGATVKGNIEELNFTLRGNSDVASGEIRMKYHDFKIDFFKKNSKKVNKLKTTIGRIFIDDGTNGDSEGYRYGEFSEPRNQSRSYFNFIWQNIKEGMINTVKGNGNKSTGRED